jgi:hypothetical protein
MLTLVNPQRCRHHRQQDGIDLLRHAVRARGYHCEQCGVRGAGMKFAAALGLLGMFFGAGAHAEEPYRRVDTVPKYETTCTKFVEMNYRAWLEKESVNNNKF